MHSSLGNVMEKVLAAYRKSSKQWCSTLNKLADGVLLLAYSLLKLLWHDKHKVRCNLTTSRIKQMEKQFPGAITFFCAYTDEHSYLEFSATLAKLQDEIVNFTFCAIGETTIWLSPIICQICKRQNVMTKGLKDDLVKRLDEAVRAENQTHDNGVHDINHPKVPSNDAIVKPVVAEQTTNIEDGNNSERQILGEDNNITTKLDTNQSLEKDNNGIENLNNEDRDVLVESTVSAETSVLVNEVMVSEEVRKQDSQTNKGGVSNLQPSGKVGRILEADLRAGDKDSCMCYTYSRSKGHLTLERLDSAQELSSYAISARKNTMLAI